MTPETRPLNPAENKTFRLCCVVDSHPRFIPELFLWITCVDLYLPHYFTPHIFLTQSVRTEVHDWLLSKKVCIQTMDTLLESSPHCNKIYPFTQTFEEDYIIFTDTDLYFVENFSVFIKSKNIRAAPNNHCAPPSYIFEKIFSASNRGFVFRPGLSVFPNHNNARETHINNISAGIIVIPSEKAKHFAEKWLFWAQWLSDHSEILENWSVHVDQVSFALALEDLNEDVEHLSPSTNCILQLVPYLSKIFGFHLSTGHIPHFSNTFTQNKTLQFESLPPMTQTYVDRLNKAINEAITEMNQFDWAKETLDTFLNPSWIR